MNGIGTVVTQDERGNYSIFYFEEQDETKKKRNLKELNKFFVQEHAYRVLAKKTKCYDDLPSYVKDIISFEDFSQWRKFYKALGAEKLRRYEESDFTSCGQDRDNEVLDLVYEMTGIRLYPYKPDVCDSSQFLAKSAKALPVSSVNWK